MSTTNHRHTHTNQCSSLTFVVTTHGALQLRFLCNVTNEIDHDAFSHEDSRVNSEIAQTLQLYPDINNACMLTRAMVYPESVTTIVEQLVDELIRFRGTMIPEQTCSMLRLATQLRDMDMVRIVFLFLCIYVPSVRQYVLLRSDRVVGPVFLDYAKSTLTKMCRLLTTPDTVHLHIIAMMTVLRDNVFFKRVSVMRQFSLPLFVNMDYVPSAVDVAYQVPSHPPPLVDGPGHRAPEYTADAPWEYTNERRANTLQALEEHGMDATVGLTTTQLASIQRVTTENTLNKTPHTQTYMRQVTSLQAMMEDTEGDDDLASQKRDAILDFARLL